MAIRNVARGGGKKFKSEITGLKELEAKLKELTPDNPRMARDIAIVVQVAGERTRDIMRSSAQAAGWPASTLRYIFDLGDPDKQHNRKKITALVGVSKGFKTGHILNPPAHPMYREWYSGPFPKKKKTGKVIGMGWSTMLEFGTSRMKARPAIRSAVSSAKGPIIQAITNGFQSILDRYTK